MTERLDTLQNFFLSEISDIKVEINQKTSKEISTGNDEKFELLQNQIIYLKEKCNSKSQLINLILENVFKNDIPKVTSYKNSNTLLTPKGNYQFPKDLVKTTIRKVLVTATLMNTDFMLFLLMRTVKIAMKMYTSQSHHVKQNILTTIKVKNIRPEKLTEIDLLIRNSAKENSQ